MPQGSSAVRPTNNKKREFYEIILCRGKSEVLIAEGVSSIKILVPESEKKVGFYDKR